MIRHFVCLTWKEGTPRRVVDAARLEVLALPDKIPEIRRLSVGHDLGLADDNADLAIALGRGLSRPREAEASG